MKLANILGRVDIIFTKGMISRPDVQAGVVINKLSELILKKVDKLIDVGGGDARYKTKLLKISKEYSNLEILKNKNVDILGSVYDIPIAKNRIDIVVLFTVLEHLSEPKAAFTEVARVLKKGGYAAITTVQYWHTHNHPSDYLRYTKAGLEYYCKETGFKVVDIWSQGGPFLVIFHAMELNMTGNWRTIFSIFFYRLFDWLDWVVYKHNDTRLHSDSVGWSLIAQKI